MNAFHHPLAVLPPTDASTASEDDWDAPTLLTLPNPRKLTTSIRATAQVFQDPRSAALLERVRMVAPSDANVLIIGETGTGKELIARHVHDLSRRSGKPFVAVNCGAFSENLVESELFGHEKGAFTGAFSAKTGWFEAANGGTLFLDEIGDLPLSIQVKLLRVLQEREVVRLGSRKSVPIDVRVVAATNVRLQDAVAAGHFREDLFYRLHVVHLALPTLRERPGDILPLARHFIEEYRQRLGYGPVRLDAGAEHKLAEYGWPGNIRELENVIHHALLISQHGVIGVEHLHLSSLNIQRRSPENSEPRGSATPRQALEGVLRDLFNEPSEQLFEEIEETVMRAAFEFCHRNQVQAAKLLGISRNVLRSRLIKSREISALK
ncbi:DNA-binding NtrC family response regulator [Variovorax boronicumulans]|uniref:sigma-54 interaction domain-containing protein n=1 Tax=Variovorax boronicumulans TaxID=436515 RepID=UPI002475DB0C|nr:sigma-54 dependent transcriptional regulator [Variovorax boronicumulans]MDH6166843.1 DNA-binding NtrC family response regulator [Variovorax boronicumulans]